ncbi:hypothetical protein EDC04DRAFT_2611869 [Pisolithus marmoratus]|nr:hypothetical protein EDC04DRAFT_2611869 [Pisolithus marmoratus]
MLDEPTTLWCSKKPTTVNDRECHRQCLQHPSTRTFKRSPVSDNTTILTTNYDIQGFMLNVWCTMIIHPPIPPLPQLSGSMVMEGTAVFQLLTSQLVGTWEDGRACFHIVFGQDVGGRRSTSSGALGAWSARWAGSSTPAMLHDDIAERIPSCLRPPVVWWRTNIGHSLTFANGRYIASSPCSYATWALVEVPERIPSCLRPPAMW